MSIKQVQTKNILELVAQSFFVNGINPQLTQVYSHLSAYFAKQFIGQPATFDLDAFRKDIKSDADLMNDFMAYLIVNIDTLYETCQQQIEQIFMLNTLLRTHLDRLRIRRDILEKKIDDYLLSIFNSDGYFYSFSDEFTGTSYVDFSFTTASVDTNSDTVTISPISTMSNYLNASKLNIPHVTITDVLGSPISFTEKTPFANAIDGMTNTAWYMEVQSDKVGPFVATIELFISADSQVTEINLTPHGVTPVQCGITATFAPNAGQGNYEKPFTNKVITSANKIKFIGDDLTDNISSIKIQLTKDKADYTLNNGHQIINTFIFGFKEILMAEQFYDTNGTLVTQPISIPSDLAKEAVIDAVSLVTEDTVVTNTTLTYYVAEDDPEALSVSDFEWKRIVPISSTDDVQNNIVHFEGSSSTRRMIRRTPRVTSDLKLYDFDITNSDLALRNPSPAFFAGVDIYRLAEFKEEFLKDTLQLEEGINTTRVYYIEYNANAVKNGFAFWAPILDDSSLYSTTYGEIDTGHDFFYGADVGESNKSVYSETYIECDKDTPIFLKECRKSDINSRSWEVRLFLNGREIANMPVGVDKITVPWKLQQGQNHIVVMANIPPATIANPSPYVGTFAIMSDSNLTDYGVVKLSNWTYVDVFKFQNNQVNDPYSFTIYNNQIVSRRKPTNNFRISYKQKSSMSPDAIRLRVDFTRDSQSPTSSPILDLYRLRFAYR